MKDSIERGWRERTVTVDRLKLLDTLKTNRETHQREYRESVAGYRQAAIKELERQLAKAVRLVQENGSIIRMKIEKFDPDDPLDDLVTVISSISFNLEVPKDHTKSYDVAIEMATWEVSETIELTQSQFQCFVMDDWEWKREFEGLNKTYSGRK